MESPARTAFILLHINIRLVGLVSRSLPRRDRAPRRKRPTSVGNSVEISVERSHFLETQAPAHSQLDRTLDSAGSRQRLRVFVADGVETLTMDLNCQNHSPRVATASRGYSTLPVFFLERADFERKVLDEGVSERFAARRARSSLFKKKAKKILQHETNSTSRPMRKATGASTPKRTRWFARVVFENSRSQEESQSVLWLFTDTLHILQQRGGNDTSQALPRRRSVRGRAPLALARRAPTRLGQTLRPT